jgi:citrate lyase subunit beta/citryl-CoA lyase
MDQKIPLWRSMLFVPVNIDRFVNSAARRGADACILDLEDSIPAAEKSEARKGVLAAAETVGSAGADVVVRINRPWRLAIRDIEASVDSNICALAVPKVADASHLCAIAETLSELEAERGLELGHTRLIAMIETPDAYFQIRDIAAASPRVVAMTLGQEDFALSGGMEPEPEALFQPCLQIVLASRAAGILPLGFVGSIAEYRDQEKFRQIVRQARRIGFTGAFCIHPLQAQVLNEEFSPTADEVAAAEDMISAYEDATLKGRGSIEYRGKMLDEPIVERARQILLHHRRIENRTYEG